MNRRHFLSATAAAAAAAGVTVLPVAARASGVADLVLYRASHPAARRLADALAARGAVAIAIGGGARPQWYHDLRASLAAGARSLAGAGSRSEYLIVESLARSHGLRLRHHGLHALQTDGRLMHTLRVPVAPVAGLDALAEAGDDWPDGIAALLDASTPGQLAAQPLRLPARHDAPAGGAAPLISWLFA